MHAFVLSCFSRVWLCNQWTVARQAPLSMGFSRQEYWSGLPCPSPGDLPDLGIEPISAALQADSLPWATREALYVNIHLVSWLTLSKIVSYSALYPSSLPSPHGCVVIYQYVSTTHPSLKVTHPFLRLSKILHWYSSCCSIYIPSLVKVSPLAKTKFYFIYFGFLLFICLAAITILVLLNSHKIRKNP